MSADPFAFLRSLVPAASSSADSVPAGAVDSSAANPVESDLFSGSEPVPAEATNTAAAPEADTSAVSNSGLVVDSGSVPTISAPASVQGDIGTAILAAITDLDNRVKVIEAYLRQNGMIV